MTQALVTNSTPNSSVIESVITAGDLSRLEPIQRVNYYTAVCQSVGLNPLTKPFEYITLNGKMVLYARKDATDQLRDIRKVSITRLERERIDSVYVVTAYAQTVDGRTDSSMGVVNIEGLKGDALANALMKSETKAKRRVTLSICGLGMLDETELGTIPDARPANVNLETGEIVQPARTITVERPAPTSQAAANDAAFESLPSASAERAPSDRYEGGKADRAGNGKTTPATTHGERPFKDQGSAVQWACRFPHYRKDDKPDIPHAVGSLKKLCAELGCSDREVDCWADAWMDHVAAKAAATMEPTHEDLDKQAAAQS